MRYGELAIAIAIAIVEIESDDAVVGGEWFGGETVEHAGEDPFVASGSSVVSETA